MIRRLPEDLLRRMGERLSAEDRDELAIPSYLHPNPAMRWMAWHRLEVVADRLGRLLAARAPPRTVVDFGCGTGVLFEVAAVLAERVIGVDPVLAAAELLLAERPLPGVELVGTDALAEAVAPASVDVVVAVEVLEHIDPPGPVLVELGSLLRPGGRLLVSLPTENRLYRLGRRLAGFSGHYHHWDARSVDREIRRLGYRLRWRRSIPLPGPGAIYWVREYERW